MGNTFEIIADVDADETEAAAIAAEILAWLGGAGIIERRPTDCVLGAKFGYPPGPQFRLATAGEDDGLMRLVTNGLEVTVGRAVFHPISTDVGPVSCPHCDQVVILQALHYGKMTDAWELFADAIGRWCDGGSSQVTCVHCHASADFNDWKWLTDWPFALGCLGFEFWNWPRLDQEFIDEFRRRLGHRIVVTRGKL